MKYLTWILFLPLMQCLYIFKDKNKIDLTATKQNQSDVDIVYTVRGKNLALRLSDEEYSASLLVTMRKENYFANPKVFSKNEYFFLNDFSKYKIELDIHINDNFDNPSMREGWILGSLMTLGMIPYYSNTKYISKMKIFSKDKRLLKEFEYENEVDFYFHLFLFPLSFWKNQSNKTMDEILKKTAKEFNLIQ